MADTRGRNFEFIVYPDSAPNNWIEYLNDLHLCWVKSPIHDKDINEDTGELKKAHWHCVLAFAGKKSKEQIEEISCNLGSAPWRKVSNMRGMVRYLIHIDDPYKAQYKRSDIECYGGFDISSFFDISKSERYQIISEMIDFINQNDIHSFRELMDYSRYAGKEEWFRALCDDSAYIMSMYIKNPNDCGGIV